VVSKDESDSTLSTVAEGEDGIDKRNGTSRNTTVESIESIVLPEKGAAEKEHSSSLGRQSFPLELFLVGLYLKYTLLKIFLCYPQIALILVQMRLFLSSCSCSCVTVVTVLVLKGEEHVII
jgi:hypothetical protein